MEPQTPQFGPFVEGVRKLPAGSKPLTPGNPQRQIIYKSPDDVITSRLPVNAVKNPYGDSLSQKYAGGFKRGYDYAESIPAEVTRPKPNQGTKVSTPGQPPKVIGGEKADVKIKPMKPIGRGGGGIGGIFGIKNR